MRGPLGRTEFYEEIFDDFDPGTEEYEYARMMREAHLGGEEVVMAQFNVMLGNDPAALKARAMNLAQFKYALAEVGDITFDKLITETKARDAIISLTEKASRTSDKHKESDISRLYHVLEKISEQSLGKSEVDVPYFDPATEEVIELEDLSEKEDTDETEEKGE